MIETKNKEQKEMGKDRENEKDEKKGVYVELYVRVCMRGRVCMHIIVRVCVC